MDSYSDSHSRLNRTTNLEYENQLGRPHTYLRGLMHGEYVENSGKILTVVGV